MTIIFCLSFKTMLKKKKGKSQTVVSYFPSFPTECLLLTQLFNDIFKQHQITVTNLYSSSSPDNECLLPFQSYQ